MIINDLYSKEYIFVKFNQLIHPIMHIYSTNLTDHQWSKIVNFFTARKRKHPLRSIVNALLYLTKTGVQWRILPSDFPK